MVGGVLPGAVITAYGNVIQALADASANGNGGYIKLAKPVESCFKIMPTDGDLVEFDVHLHLSDWSDRKEKISILVRAQETIRRKTQVLLKSSVLLCYFRIKDNTATHLHSIHFDYGNEEPRHPVFHAQMCMDIIKPSARDAETLEFQYELSESSPKCFKNARIPTSDMTLASVLVYIAANRLNEKFFTQFLESVHRQDHIPLPAIARTKKSFDKQPKHLRSSHWYAHMFS